MPPSKQQGCDPLDPIDDEGRTPAEGPQLRPPSRRRRWRRPAQQLCHCCGRSYPFCWRCRCGFEICQACMDENVWGMSCNHITWQCPDCGALNGLGNQ